MLATGNDSELFTFIFLSSDVHRSNNIRFYTEDHFNSR